MTSRLLLAATVYEAAVRRKRRDDDSIYALMKVRDNDRLETRIWKLYANDAEMIEQLEEMRVGEPIAVSGPFSFAIVGSGAEPRIEYRITAQTIVDTRRRRKSKTTKRLEEQVALDDPEIPTGGAEGLNDELGF